MIPEARRVGAGGLARRDGSGEEAASGSTIPRGAGLGQDRGRAWPSSPGPKPGGAPAANPLGSGWSVLPTVVHEFTAAWERGESPVAEDYLRRLDPADVQGAVDLIYREYCLFEADGCIPDPDSYVGRFPVYGEILRRLFQVHGACSPSLLGRLLGPPPASDPGSQAEAGPGPSLPNVGDSIGPYLLRRELGRGSFARVFLAEQADLANRLVVIKVAARTTQEPWLLARARHAHIVEILSHSPVDDGAFQLICMPFWGGATLADVLDGPSPGTRSRGSGSASASPSAPPATAGHHRRRRRGRDWRPATGADLLAALDAVAAPEYPSVHPARPAREILAPLSYDRAIAWVIARLAEALDHAAGQGVTHSDVKPSNILLSADGNPMLLDFNLASDEVPSLSPSGRPMDPGGTLAYMAPERLRALTRACQSADPGVPAGPSWSSPAGSAIRAAAAGAGGPPADRSAGQAAHVADIYSLATVLLEALTGRPPCPAPMPGGQDAGRLSRPARLSSMAGAYAAARERPPRALIREFEAASGRPIAPALRAILERCLDPDPSRRYRRALELAEDLDRWRTNRPLAYADEPFWRQAVPRWVRARRRMLALSAVAILGVGLIATAAVLIGSARLHRRGLEALAQNKLARHWDDPQAGAFLRSQRLHAQPRSWQPDDLEAFKVAHRALLDYQILGPGDVPAAGDWRLGDDIRYLPAAARDDLEAWLIERAYRFCRTQADRPGSPAERRRVLEILDRAAAGRSFRAFAPLRDRLAARLRSPTIPPATIPAPAWLDEHLLGFVIESEGESGPPDGRRPDPRRALEQALPHYDQALAIRPESFWGHYRAAAVHFGLGRPDEAARHLAQCLRRRPANAAVQVQLAGCLIAVGEHSQALEVCDRALESAPNYAELYWTRAYARAASQQTGGLIDDLRRFEMFRGILPRLFWDDAGSADPANDTGSIATVFRFPTMPDHRPGPARRPGRDDFTGVPPEEVEARATLAGILRHAELLPLAAAEADKILMIQPDHIPARLFRAEEAITARRFDVARSELDAVFGRPELEEYVGSPTGSLDQFFDITRLYLEAGRADDARTVAEHARDLALRIRRDVGWSHFNLARAYAVLGRSDPHFIDEAAKQLFRAFIAHPDFQQWYRAQGPWFDPVRARIDAALGRMEDPEVVRRRRMARPAAPATARVAER
jgi:serine/threonine protein kinase